MIEAWRAVCYAVYCDATCVLLLSPTWGLHCTLLIDLQVGHCMSFASVSLRKVFHEGHMPHVVHATTLH